MLPLLFFVRLVLFCSFIFACDAFLCAQNIFVKKKKKLVWNCLDNLIYCSTSAQVFSCEFCKSFKNTFFKEQLHATASIIITLLKNNFQFVMHFSPTFVTFQILTKLSKFGIVGKLLPSGALLYIFSVKRKKWSRKNENAFSQRFI